MAHNIVKLDAIGSQPAKSVAWMQAQGKNHVYRSTLREAGYAERTAKKIIKLQARIVSLKDVIDMARQYGVCERYIPWVIVEFKRETRLNLA